MPTLTARAVGNEIVVLHEEKKILRAVDVDKPYLTGMVGMVLRDGGHALYDSIRVKAL